MESFEISERDLEEENELFTDPDSRRKRKRFTKEDAIYGIFKGSDSEEDDYNLKNNYSKSKYNTGISFVKGQLTNNYSKNDSSDSSSSSDNDSYSNSVNESNDISENNSDNDVDNKMEEDDTESSTTNLQGLGFSNVGQGLGFGNSTSQGLGFGNSMGQGLGFSNNNNKNNISKMDIPTEFSS